MKKKIVAVDAPKVVEGHLACASAALSSEKTASATFARLDGWMKTASELVPL